MKVLIDIRNGIVIKYIFILPIQSKQNQQPTRTCDPLTIFSHSLVIYWKWKSHSQPFFKYIILCLFSWVNFVVEIGEEGSVNNILISCHHHSPPLPTELEIGALAVVPAARRLYNRRVHFIRWPSCRDFLGGNRRLKPASQFPGK